MSARVSKKRWTTISPEDVRSGVPAKRIDDLAAVSGIERNRILRVVGAPSTLRWRIRNKGKLTHGESDRLARLGRVVTRAIGVFGSPERAVHWLLRPVRVSLDGASPFDMLDTDPGAEWVDARLSQIAHGMFA